VRKTYVTRQETKLRGLRALRLFLYQNPDGVAYEDIDRHMTEFRTHAATTYRWLHEIGSRNIGFGVWQLWPTSDEVEYARAVIRCIEEQEEKVNSPA